MTRWSLFAAIWASAGLGAWAWAAGGYEGAAAGAAILGLVWTFAETRRVRVAAYVGFFLAAAGAAAGELRSLSPELLLLSLGLALAAWDLSDLSRRLDLAAGKDDRVSTGLDDQRELERRHLVWLGFVLFIGVGLSAVALQARSVRLNFEVAAALALLGAWGVTQLILRLRGSS